jgi:hypothetical protein
MCGGCGGPGWFRSVRVLRFGCGDWALRTSTLGRGAGSREDKILYLPMTVTTVTVFVTVTTTCFTERQHLMCSMWTPKLMDTTVPARASTEPMSVENSIMAVQAMYV